MTKGIQNPCIIIRTQAIGTGRINIRGGGGTDYLRITFSSETRFGKEDCLDIKDGSGTNNQYRDNDLSGISLFVTGGSFSLHLHTAGMDKSAFGFAITNIVPYSAQEKEAYDSVPHFEHEGSTLTRYEGNLQEVTVPGEIDGEAITAIAYRAFANANVERVILPNGLESIENNAFTNCRNLSSISLPGSLNHIGPRAFAGCGALHEIEVPTGVNDIAPDAFRDSGIESIQVAEGNAEFASQDGVLMRREGDKFRLWAYPQARQGDSYTVSGSVVAIGTEAFAHSGLREIILPGSVGDIGERAFQGCGNLHSIAIPKGVYWLNARVFQGCHSLESVSLPDSLEGMGPEVFMDCDNLREIVIPGNVREISSRVFARCHSLESVTFMGMNTQLLENVFQDCGGITLHGLEGSLAQAYYEENKEKENITFVPMEAPEELLEPPYIELFRDGNQITDTAELNVDYDVKYKIGNKQIDQLEIIWGFEGMTKDQAVFDSLGSSGVIEHVVHFFEPADWWVQARVCVNNVWSKWSDRVHLQVAGGGEECQHEWKPEKMLQEPTCQNEGIQLLRCTKCGAERTETLPPTDHKWTIINMITAPTCTKEGLAKYKCVFCGLIKEDVVPPQHTWQWEETIKEPTCTEEGEILERCTVCNIVETHYVKPNGHQWVIVDTYNEPTCTQPGKGKYVCKVCKEERIGEIAPLGHDWQPEEMVKEPSCEQGGEQWFVCARCGDRTIMGIKPLGHDWGEWEEKEAPTCVNQGTMERVCLRCGKAEQKAIDMIPHVFVEAPGYEPTAVKPGLTKGVKCAVCGLVKEPQQEIPPTGRMDEADFVLPDFLETIEAEAFSGISASVVKLSEKVTYIGSKAFAGCQNLKQIYIPAGIITIERDAFDGVGELMIFGTKDTAAETFANDHADFVTFVEVK